MQGNVEDNGAGLLDDNMAEGDLGDGMDVRLAALDLQTNGPPQLGTLRGSELPRGSAGSDPGFSLTPFGMPYTSLKTRSGSLVDLSKEELRERLQEASETLEGLRSELEVTQRYLEGKYQALKILQGKSILEKATSHTKSLLQKSEERARALEQEVNGLQWEITSNQVQMKKCQQSWEQKFNRLKNENKALSRSLEERLNESRVLRAENTGLSQQCMELLSMLSAREQKAYEGTRPPCGHGREGAVLEMAVLGACRCPGVMESCPCAKTAAASRTQLLQLRQELDLLVSSREEALLMADAFRIAFEQQLRKRSDRLLLQAEALTPKSHPRETQGANRARAGVAQRLRAILPSGLEAKASLDHTDTLQKLLDLLNDKEEALAHQRKVSHMLAHSAKELQKQLPVEATWPLDSQTKPLESRNSNPQTLRKSQLGSRLIQSDLKNKRHQLHNSMVPPKGTQDSQNPKEESLDDMTQVLDSETPPKTPTEPPDTKTPTGPPDAKTPTGPPVTKTPTEPQVTKTPTGPPVTKTPKEPPVTKTPTVPSDTKTPTGPPVTKTPTGETPDPEDPLDSKIQPDELAETNTLLLEPPDTETSREDQRTTLSYQNHEPPAATRTTGSKGAT